MSMIRTGNCESGTEGCERDVERGSTYVMGVLFHFVLDLTTGKDDIQMNNSVERQGSECNNA